MVSTHLIIFQDHPQLPEIKEQDKLDSNESSLQKSISLALLDKKKKDNAPFQASLLKKNLEKPNPNQQKPPVSISTQIY